MNSINIFYRFNVLATKRIDLVILISSSTGVELALYRVLHDEVSEEMQSLIPQIQNIFKRIRNRRIAKDIMAIYFEDISYQD